MSLDRTRTPPNTGLQPTLLRYRSATRLNPTVSLPKQRLMARKKKAEQAPD